MKFNYHILWSKFLLVVFFAVVFNTSTKAQTTLTTGDIAFTGYHSGAVGTDAFSFVILVPVTNNTVINFTDNAWLNPGVFRTGEQTVTWTVSGSLVAGTEITIQGPSAGAATATVNGSGVNGVCTGTMPSFATTGDQVFAYQGTAASPTFITGLHMNVYSLDLFDCGNTIAASWDPDCIDGAGGTVGNTIFSKKPAALITGTNAIWIGTPGTGASEFDNAVFTGCGLTLTTAADVRAAVNDPANWTTSNGVPATPLPAGCNFMGAFSSAPVFTLQPSNSSICEGTGTSFTITATGATSYQWQVDNGGGFVNVVNNANYSGAATTTLTLTNIPASFDGYLYRSVATNPAGSTNSNNVLLNVIALPLNPTLLSKTPATATVADGTPVSATFNAGSGGSGGGCLDDFRYTTNGGTSYLPYTPGTNISTTGLAAGTGFVFIEGRRSGCGSGCNNNYVVLASWVVTPLPASPTTLTAGDIAFTGYASNYLTIAEDNFSFVLLRNMGTGTTINFTDNGWLSTNVLQSAEQTVTWTAPAGGLPGGTEIKISNLTATRAGGGPAGTVTGTGLSLNTSGDQILAYQGTAAAPTFISAIHMNVYSIANGDPVTTTAAAWDGTANTTSSSALPTGLTTGVNAIWIGTQAVPASEFDNSRYGNCAGPGVLGPITALRAALNNQANWISDNNQPPSFTLPTGCNYLSALCETIVFTSAAGTEAQTVCVNSAITGITYSTTGATGASFSGLPAGVTGNWAAGVATISGTPSVTGTFNYTVTATGGSCGGAIATGSITVNDSPTGPTLLAKTPDLASICAGTGVSATFNAGSGGAGCSDDFTVEIDGGAPVVYIPGSTVGISATSSIVIKSRRANCLAGSGCTGTVYTILANWTIVASPTGPTLLAKTPNLASICSGTGVSATFNAGSGGAGCSDDYTVEIDGGGPVAYIPGSTVGASATSSIVIRGRRANCSDGSGCAGTAYTILASWTIVASPTGPTLLAKTPDLASICSGTGVSATFNPGSGGDGCSDDYTVEIDGGGPVAYIPGSTVGASATSSIVIKGRRANCTAGSGCAGTAYTILARWTVNVAPTVNAPTVVQPTCAVPTGTITVNATGSGTLEYSIDGGANWFITNVFSGLAPGNYIISVRSQDAPLCVGNYSGNPVVLNAATGCCTPVNYGTVASGNQTICYGGDPSNITFSVAPSGGAVGGSFNYQWYYKNGVGDPCPAGTSVSGWTLIGGATGSSYDPPSGLTTSRTYAVTVDPTGIPDCGPATWANSCRKVTVNAAIDYGTVASGNQTICNGGDPSNITFAVAPSGGSGSFSYQWYYKNGVGNPCPTGTSVSGWTLIGGATGSSYDPPSGLTTSRTYAVTVDPTGTPDCGPATWANSCRKVTVNTAVVATCSNNNPTLYFGYPGDQTATVKVIASGGVAPYTVSITMNRPLKCNVITSGGDELWAGVGGTSVNNVCPASGPGLTPVSTGTVAASGGFYSVNVTLMEDAIFTATVTDASGCVSTCTTTIQAEDVRCFSGGSGNAKVKICHRTGNGCHEICVSASAVSAHLGHGDFLGDCTPNCIDPAECGKGVVIEKLVLPVIFRVKAIPNPTDSYFTLDVESGSNEKIVVVVYDVLGRMVKRIEKSDNQLIRFGEEMSVGSYMAVVSQGKNTMTVKLVKQ
jgi:hypothetical protein